MIIITTTNGNYFLNEKDYNFVAHSKTERKIKAYRTDDNEDEFENVETITYTNEANPASFTFKDPGEIRKEEHIKLLYKALASVEIDLRKLACEMIENANIHGPQLPQYVREWMRSRGEEMKAMVNHDEYRKNLPNND